MNTKKMMYEYTDKIIRYLTRRFIRMFGNAKGTILQMDELHVLEYSKKLYNELETISETYFLKLAQKTYRDLSLSQKRKINSKWLRNRLSEYDPVTMYVYLNEVERKRERFAESVIASQNKAKEVDKALRYWSKMINQYAIEITDDVAIDAYIDDGVQKVQWVAVKDERNCEDCRELDGQIFEIKDIPQKPHWGCRCILIPYEGEVI